MVLSYNSINANTSILYGASVWNKMPLSHTFYLSVRKLGWYPWFCKNKMLYCPLPLTWHNKSMLMMWTAPLLGMVTQLYMLALMTTLNWALKPLNISLVKYVMFCPTLLNLTLFPPLFILRGYLSLIIQGNNWNHQMRIPNFPTIRPNLPNHLFIAFPSSFFPLPTKDYSLCVGSIFQSF